MTNTSTRKRRSLSTLITKIIILVLAPIILGIFVQSYYFSKQIIWQEVDRTKQQTSALILNIFDSHFAAIQIHHDSNSKSDVVLDFYTKRNEEALNFFFLSIDQSDPAHTPEIRFLTNHQGIIWDDGNAHFYGINDSILDTISNSVTFTNNWYYITSLTPMGARHLLVRRVPVLEPTTGEVMGYSYNVVVLDNNFGLMERLKNEGNVDNVVLISNNLPLANSLAGDESYKIFDVLKRRESQEKLDQLLIIKTPIEVNAAHTDLSLLTVQDNQSVVTLQVQHLLAMMASVIGMILIALLTKEWIENKVAEQLDSLMSYTRSAREEKGFERFCGSDIEEFDDIGTTLENTFEELEAQKRSFRDLFNFALSPIMVWSEAGVLIQINPAARKELVLENDNKTMPPVFKSFKEKLLPHLRMASQGATLTGVNVPIGEKVYRWNLSPILVDGDLSGIIVQGQDITTLIEAEKQSNVARKEAEKSAQARADFLAKMSHEIRTPINGILGVAQLLKGAVKSQEQSNQIDVLRHSGEHLLAVLNDILDFSKIEQGKFNIQKHSFSFTDTVRTLENIYRPICESKGVELVIENQLDPQVALFTDQVRLNQIMFNLLSNAVKFTPSGSVRLSAVLDQFEGVENSVLVVEVSDTGIGIDPNKLEQMFEPFVQEEETTTREYGGSGLGLTIVKSLVDMLDGNVQVYSQKGVGTTFVVTLPVRDRERLSSENKPDQHINPEDMFNQTLKVLLVEDNHTNAFILKAFCNKYEMQVEWAKDGLEAIERLKHHTYDLILMDNQLPHLGGIETTKEIRRNLKLGTPIYACTADTAKETGDAFMEAGANYILLKPIKENAFHEALLDYKQRFLVDWV
ncbi:quorum-sensing autoinducer 2 sensor kinase/phosphatase LuxQ [Vibrio natriegens]|uniref:Autoinducer 2 sensor kinase/phosphatase LuxQ n=2 Tax=Vibrio TaxID=662 RepID=A0AAN0Y7B1_VIBNA|nr:quorum-sensing autoinducer 2 sensor kinase/phosphatase LuxQ [Vibrio natriegens]ALR17854.1 ATPase [Vibrio natriegens NBRC 15636 = ATCC 14048 = DSM 759]ANQ15346.1 ATPase [Vibrio natriegens NBRC 15636 = ATCC 14048 = DSM 759]EPM41052.1 ATPase [Vibrio natriegens NBRC 15636 = ATCC 14048 = DSM 759]MDX6029300.1 quorum-sensing autoinducer 2 sensor kinase/phosphatase LuxQ [Vibrio natriegens NBRC 15636 = ATCC 14048 = DSM 759]UUI13996.1 ATP-binding protein [Vibrio natriegens]